MTSQSAKAKKTLADKGYNLVDASTLPKTEFIPTGFPELDALIKGFPRKRISEVYGPVSSSKSTLLLTTIAAMDKSMKALYVDMENAVDADWVKQQGITKGQMILATPLVLEDAAQLILDDLPNFDLIVLDSVAAALFRTEEASEIGQYNIGIKARIMTSFMRRLLGPLAKSNVAAVFINQEKPTIGEMYGPKWYQPGGKALEYSASLRLRLTSNKADRIVKKGNRIGKIIKVEVTKNKVGPPDGEANFAIYYAGKN